MSNHRATDHIFVLRTLLDKYVTHTTKSKLYTCFIDFKKAFDSVWHDGLLCKSLRYKIGVKFYDLIKTLYIPRQNVPLNMDIKEVRHGPNIIARRFIPELPTICRCLVLISSSANALQNALSTLFQFCLDWRMNINTKKTKAIIFQKKHRKSTLLKYNFF